MAYVDDQGHDVFISYAHNDNEDDGASVRWVEHFGKQLSVKLLKQLGEAASVWWDPELERSQKFDDVIEAAVRKSAVMISLISPSYEKSAYCQQELAWFADRSVLKTKASRSCVLPVLLYNIPFERWPELSQGPSGFDFYEPGASALSRPLDARGKAFSDRQWTLVSELAVILEELKDSKQRSADASQPSNDQESQAYNVFLATAADDLASDRRFLKKELEKEGINVVSKIPPPYDEKGHAQATLDAVSGADLSVHLLGNYPGASIDEDNPTRTFPIEQTKIALENARRQFILLPESFSQDAIIDEHYSGFIDELQQKPRATEQFQIIKDSRQQMLSEILQARQLDKKIAAYPGEASQTGATSAFVDLHVSDLSHISDLVGYLANRSIATVTVPASDTTPKVGWDLFEQYLRSTQLFIVVYGAVGREWVQERLVEAFKLITEKGLSTRMGIYVAPPDKSAEQINFGICDVMLNTKVFDPSTIEPLLKQVSGTHK